MKVFLLIVIGIFIGEFFIIAILSANSRKEQYKKCDRCMEKMQTLVCDKLCKYTDISVDEGRLAEKCYHCPLIEIENEVRK